MIDFSHMSNPLISGYDGADFGEDHLDFGDNISMQHEINRLTQEVRRLQAENTHWRSQQKVRKITLSSII